MSEAPELNVWREASDAASENAVKWKPAAEDRAAAVIRTYGDQRDADARSEGHAEGYAQAVADVVKWLEDGGDVVAASYIEQRFGKDQDHG